MKPPQSANAGQQSWEEFCHIRLDYVRALGEVVEQGFIRRDTQHPVFCGCVDWHSSVHGAYALLAAARLTGKSCWAETVNAALSVKCLDAELASLRQGELAHEMPYGFSWLLRLAIEKEQGWGEKDLLPLAIEIASRIEQWVFSLSAGEVIRHFQQREYGNLAWALLNLWNWNQLTSNQVMLDKILHFTRMWVVLLDETLPPSYDNATDEFFAASLQRTRAILTILPQGESQAWLKAFYTNKLSLTPMKRAHTPHSAGLNFSRAWTFWTLYICTGDEDYRNLYVDHIVTHMQLPEYWRDDYQKHAHWVPQFGIYALVLSLDHSI